MIIEDEFLMPDYYSEFSCKMGGCRAACCVGWPISLSVADYFKLLGTECSAELRRKLDCGMHLLDHPIPEAYAQISPRYDGECPMRMDDGRCGIQAELGADALASVCRLYPRGIRLNDVRECSCANSCEAVLELLLNRTEPITFQRRQLAVSMPEILSIPDSPGSIEHIQDIRLWLISIMQERKYPLTARIMMVGQALESLENVLKSHGHIPLDQLWAMSDFGTFSSMPKKDVDNRILETAKELLHYAADSSSLSEYISTSVEDYEYANKAFSKLFPQWELWFEHILVNHMFFTQFPLEDPPIPFHDKFLALCAVYVLMRYLCLGNGATDMAAIVDVVAAVFRVVDHTDFDHYIAQILKKLNCTGNEDAWQLLCI